jgi:hypothetical protein
MGECDAFYDAFVEKFKVKKTTDDCYTPPYVYAAILDWVRSEYGITCEIVRPFFPGGDYEHYSYPQDCVVVDNPPFSIMAKILNFYNERGIKFFLFAPHLTLFSNQATKIVTASDIIYENGARVSTSFYSNLEDDDLYMRTAPKLAKAIEESQNSAKKDNKAKMLFPSYLVNAARFGRIFCKTVDFRLLRSECVFVRQFCGQSLYGGGIIMNQERTAQMLEEKHKADEKSKADEKRKELELQPTPQEQYLIDKLNNGGVSTWVR